MKSKAGRVIVLIVVLIAAVSVWRSQKREQPISTAMLQGIADKFNKNLPMEANGLRSEKITVGPGLEWTFSYTLLTRDNSQETSEFISDNLLAPLKKNLCSSDLVLENVIYKLQFHDRTGNEIRTEQITLQDCRAAV